MVIEEAIEIDIVSREGEIRPDGSQWIRRYFTVVSTFTKQELYVTDWIEYNEETYDS